jgi:outer membrane lipoprotein LolB
VKRALAAAAVLAIASGCATLPPPVTGDDWPARREALQALAHWTIDGRIAVAAGDEGFSGGFDWAQQGERADIELAGPMGGSAMTIRVEGGKAAVSVRGEALDAADADELFARYFGARRGLPVGEMRYWLVGAPAPGAPAEETLAEGGRLESLVQSGWQVRYERYEAVGGIALPARLEMTTEGLRLRVAVSGWTLPP